MLRLRLKRLICFCLTLCLLFCSNMTVFAIEPLEQTKEKYFKFTFEYPIDYFIDYDYSRSGEYSNDPSIAVPTNPNQSNYNSFFYKDLLNLNGDMAWTELVLECNGTEVIRTEFYNFYNKLNLNNNNKSNIEDNLDFLKSLSNIEDISSLDYEFDGDTLKIIIPYNDNVSNIANSYDFFSNLTSYVDTNSDDSGNITSNEFTTSDGTVNRLVLNRDLLDNNNIYKGAVMDKSSTANHLSSSYYGSSNLKSFGIDFYFDRNSDDSYSQVCNINFDLYYFLRSKGIIDTTNLYKDITYGSYTPTIIDSVSEDKYNISNIRFENKNNKFKFDFSSDKYFTTYKYRLYPDCPDLSNSMLQLTKYCDSTSGK